jgi:hypothetical protein
VLQIDLRLPPSLLGLLSMSHRIVKSKMGSWWGPPRHADYDDAARLVAGGKVDLQKGQLRGCRE